MDFATLFDGPAREAIRQATSCSRLFGHQYVGTDHLFYGIVAAAPPGYFANHLVTMEGVERALAKVCGRTNDLHSQSLPVTFSNTFEHVIRGAGGRNLDDLVESIRTVKPEQVRKILHVIGLGFDDLKKAEIVNAPGDNWSASARDALRRASLVGQRMGSSVGLGHAMLALNYSPDSSDVLREHCFRPDRFEACLGRYAGRDTSGYTRDFQDAIRLAETLARKGDQVGPLHLLLAILTRKDSEIGRVLLDYGWERETLIAVARSCSRALNAESPRTVVITQSSDQTVSGNTTHSRPFSGEVRQDDAMSCKDVPGMTGADLRKAVKESAPTDNDIALEQLATTRRNMENLVTITGTLNRPVNSGGRPAVLVGKVPEAIYHITEDVNSALCLLGGLQERLLRLRETNPGLTVDESALSALGHAAAEFSSESDKFVAVVTSSLVTPPPGRIVT